MDSPKDLSLLLIDCDGVLTDGRLHIDHTGEKMFKSFHTRDIRALREFTSRGWEIVIVTADDWPGIFHFANKVGAEVIIAREKEKVEIGCTRPFVCVGDDAWDVKLLQKAAISFCPADADHSVKLIPNIRPLFAKGGEGVIAEMARWLLS